MISIGRLVVGMAMASGDVEERGRLEVEGELHASLDQSAIERWGDRLLIAGDEGGRVQLLRRSGARSWVVEGDFALGLGEDEFDLEALAVVGDGCWALGSHSLARGKVKKSLDLAENRARLEQIRHDPQRDGLYHFPLREGGGLAGPPRRIDLRPMLEADPVLAPFTAIPGKENGIDFEGLAWHDGHLYLGLRSPVLRGNLAVVLVFDPESPEKYQRRYLELDGQGVRSLDTVEGGMLGIAGPPAEADGAARLFFWDGRDGLPGEDAADPAFRWLGEIPTPKKGKAEGLTVLDESKDEIRIVVVYDGLENGAPTIFSVSR